MSSKHLLGIAAALAAASGCTSYQTIQTGHKGLLFDPHGTKREILPEGRYALGHMCSFHACSRVIDFDVTYTTSHEEIKTTSKDNLTFDVELNIIYKPIVSELYELATEVSTTDYYHEVVQPEFRSAASRVFARHGWSELGADKEKIENEIEADVQRRIQGKHIAVTSVTIEFTLPAEIRAANQARIVSEQESLRQHAAMEQDALRQKTQIENEDLKQKLAAQRESERAQQQTKNRELESKLELERALEQKQNERAIAKAEAERLLEEKENERKIAEEDAKLERARTAGVVAKAKADAEARVILAHALAEENRAKSLAVSPLLVQMRAYEALGQLGGNGTTVMLGDFSKLPSFLLPPQLMSNMMPWTRAGGGGGEHASLGGGSHGGASAP
jgi:regulator of protease activity HflC (stomatin/prohibitin superfamily)